jgi:hypothetical protein
LSPSWCSFSPISFLASHTLKSNSLHFLYIYTILGLLVNAIRSIHDSLKKKPKSTLWIIKTFASSETWNDILHDMQLLAIWYDCNPIQQPILFVEVHVPTIGPHTLGHLHPCQHNTLQFRLEVEVPPLQYKKLLCTNDQNPKILRVC